MEFSGVKVSRGHQCNTGHDKSQTKTEPFCPDSSSTRSRALYTFPIHKVWEEEILIQVKQNSLNAQIYECFSSLTRLFIFSIDFPFLCMHALYAHCPEKNLFAFSAFHLFRFQSLCMHAKEKLIPMMFLSHCPASA